MTAKLEAQGFHVGMVVEDAAATTAEYESLLGGTYELWEYIKPPPGPTAPSLEASRLLIGYGRFGGMTIEAIQVLDGHGIHADFVAKHGFGVQHLGFWVPDLSDALERALTSGATLSSAHFVSPDAAVVNISEAEPRQVASMIGDTPIYIGTANGPLDLELLGPATFKSLSGRFGDRTAAIIDAPAWAG
jgi:catechol 2,3-dioxygenase-like lactoylglutathione lyase family enzyme